MFIRKKKGVYKGSTYINYQLVESVRTPNGPRQKVICSLGNLKGRTQKQWLELARKVESTLSRQLDLLEEYDEEVANIVKKIEDGAKTPRAKLKREKDQAEPQTDDLVTVRSQEVRTELHREAGPVHVGYQYWKKLGLPEILADVRMKILGGVFTDQGCYSTSWLGKAGRFGKFRIRGLHRGQQFVVPAGGWSCWYSSS